MPVDFQLSFLGPTGTLGDLGGGVGGWNTTPGTATWGYNSVSATAPAGTAYIEVYTMFMDNAQTAAENVYFDNMSLTVVPEPSSLALLGLGVMSTLIWRRRQ
jgi:hypothetical protein